MWYFCGSLVVGRSGRGFCWGCGYCNSGYFCGTFVVERGSLVVGRLTFILQKCICPSTQTSQYAFRKALRAYSCLCVFSVWVCLYVVLPAFFHDVLERVLPKHWGTSVVVLEYSDSGLVHKLMACMNE